MDDRSDGRNGSIGGTGFAGHGRRSRTFGEGRVCGETGCGTQLSIYNDGDYCFRHEPELAPRLRGRKIA